MGDRRATVVACAALWLSCVHNTQDAHRDAAWVFVSGKAYLCGEEHAVGKPAAGRTIRLVTRDRVLAEDVVGLDGSYVLHPKESFLVTDPIYIEAGDRRVTLANNYASWIQDHLTYHGDVRFGCGPPESEGGAAQQDRPPLTTDSDADADSAGSRLPSPQLIPKN